MSQRILYFISPGTNISPFDVTMAADSGFDQVIPLTGIENADVTPLIQDAIFCRPPKRFNDTGIFIGGRDVNLATDMMESAKKAMVPPFEVGVFADPNGAYTTSAAVVALVEKSLNLETGSGLTGKKVAVMGSGPVGLAAAVLAAKQGAEPYLCQLVAGENIKAANRFCERYEVEVPWVSAETQNEKIEAIEDADVIISAVKAGIRVLDRPVLEHAQKLVVAADTNAVPPSGIDGVGMQDNNALIEFDKVAFRGVGSLAIGNLKYKTQFGLFEKIQTSEKAAFLDFPEAFEFALEVLHGKDKPKVVEQENKQEEGAFV